MKSKLLSILSLCLIVTQLQAQSVKITSNGYILKGNDVHSEECKLSSGTDGYLIVFKDGFITRGESTENIFSKGKSEYSIDLKPLAKPTLPKELKKIKFAKFVDRTNQIAYMYNNTIIGVNMGSAQAAAKINSELNKAGFNVVDDDNPDFKGKDYTPDLAIMGEVIYYTKKTRGTPGFKIGVLVKWSVYDVEYEKVIYKVTTAGYADNGKSITEDASFQIAAKDAVWGLITDDGFDKLCSKSEGGDAGLGAITLPLIAKTSYTDYPNMIENSVKSAVTIKTESGYGSGFIISESGYVLTNYHVIADTGKYEAIFNGGLTLPVTLVAKNKKRDVALLKITGGGFKALAIDTTEAAQKTGTDVIAIGTPANIKLGQTVTKGIISGMRDIDEQKLIQTDVSINSGNSGGALINKNGEVIGIVVAKMKGDNIEGLGFAIPINLALQSLNLKFQ